MLNILSHCVMKHKGQNRRRWSECIRTKEKLTLIFIVENFTSPLPDWLSGKSHLCERLYEQIAVNWHSCQYFTEQLMEFSACNDIMVIWVAVTLVNLQNSAMVTITNNVRYKQYSNLWTLQTWLWLKFKIRDIKSWTWNQTKNRCDTKSKNKNNNSKINQKIL